MQLHHHTYDRKGGGELLTDLRAICDRHHKELHAYAKERSNGDLWAAFEAISGGAKA